MATMLLQSGADVDVRDEDGQSPLLLAVRGRYQGPGCCSGHEELDRACLSGVNKDGMEHKQSVMEAYFCGAVWKGFIDEVASEDAGSV